MISAWGGQIEYPNRGEAGTASCPQVQLTARLSVRLPAGTCTLLH